MNPLRLLATALTFLTRLPLVARWSYPDAQALARSAIWWPVVGAMLGGFAAGVYLAALHVFTPHIAAILATAFTVLVTGAFHEDGVADSADGLYGGFSVERRLEIMKDSRIGTFGAVALILVLGLKIALLTSIAPQQIFAACILSHALARTSSLPVTCLAPYARHSGNNKPIAEGMTWPVVLTGVLSMAAMLAVLHPERWLWIVLGCALLWPLLSFYSLRKIGGITGDVLGAINQLTELLVLMIFAAV